MKRILRWVIGILAVLILFLILAILSFDTIVRLMAEKRIHSETGMAAQIDQLEISFRSQRIHIENLKLMNPPEFGGDTFLDLRELEVQYDLDSLQSNQLHLKVVRLDLAEVHIVQNKDGRKNIELLQKHLPALEGSSDTKGVPKSPLKFTGIDHLVISLGRTRFTNERHPEQNFARDLGIRNRVYRDIKNEKDLQSIQWLLVAQSGFSLWLQQPSEK